ncbi:MAG: hypothetical protein AVDCRST_MAG89-1780 [uncultured Gemmatimonadetes bacterium]|uniref:HTTM domain-containing protein n=1 Tax=uncultured Gemmatimonadota bacterium TaxID=203437 RepID=A0A6J4L4P6_9BACT|nr:MAG: hypothetical protein AVDCRST_MAG89-1780 [uncultured Gemmatimonadota bacterium]
MTMGRESLLWNTLIVLLAGVGMLALLRAWAPSRIGRWVPPATAEALGATRFWVAAILLAGVCWEDLASSAYLPREMLSRDVQWIAKLLLRAPIGFDQFLVNPDALRGLHIATGVLLACAALGAFTRWTIPAAVLCYLLMGSILRSYDHLFHQGVVPLYALTLLAFAPCSDALSVDRWLRGRRGLPVAPSREPSLKYGLGRYLVWLAIALCYAMAGWSKLRNTGLLWWEPGQMKHLVYTMAAEPTHFNFQGWRLLADAPGWVWAFVGLISLAGEVLFVLVLVSRRARWIFPMVMMSMHLGILYMQNIFFPDLIAIQAVFYPWGALLEPLRRRWHARRARPAPLQPAAGSVLAGPEKKMALVAAAFTVLCFTNWAARTEKFPFTAWQMFSRRAKQGPVEHVRPMVVYADGTRERARFERWIWAVTDARFRWLLTDWDDGPERVAVLRRFLDASAAVANASAPPGRRVAFFEIELRMWDYRRHPHGPEHAELVRVVRHPEQPRTFAPAARARPR